MCIFVSTIYVLGKILKLSFFFLVKFSMKKTCILYGKFSHHKVPASSCVGAGAGVAGGGGLSRGVNVCYETALTTTVSKFPLQKLDHAIYIDFLMGLLQGMGN